MAVLAEHEFLVLGADAPGFGRLIAGFEIADQVSLAGDGRVVGIRLG